MRTPPKRTLLQILSDDLTLMVILSLFILLASLSVANAAPSREGRFGERFDQADTNGDGVLTPDEVSAFPRLMQADRNEDGAIDRREVLAYISENRQRLSQRERTNRRAERRANASMEVHRDIAYTEIEGVDPNLLSLDIYQPKTEGQHPVVIMIHGGGWSIGDKSSDPVGAGKAIHFTREGYVYASVNYRLSPQVQHPAHVEDVAQSIAWVIENIADYGGNPEQIGLMGHSAGAHLAALVAIAPEYLEAAGASIAAIDGVILLDGAGYNIPFRMEESRPVGRVGEMFTDAFTDDPEVQADASPTLRVKEGQPIAPFLIIHAGRRQVAKEAATELAATLNEAGMTASTFHAADKDHGGVNRDIGQPGPLTDAVFSFFKTHVKEKPIETADRDTLLKSSES